MPNTLQVTTLHPLPLRVAQNPKIQSLDGILRSLANLRHLLLTSPSDVTLQPPPLIFGAPIVAMNYLATLTVTSNFLPGLLRGLSLPSLATLIFADIFNSGNVASI